jgi:transmembrane sensor
MTVSEIKLLLDKYKRNQISTEEYQLLLKAVADDMYADTIKADIMETLYEETPDAGWEPEDASATLRSILVKDEEEIRHIRWIRQRRLVYRSVAAALIAGIVATGFYVIIPRKAAKQVAQAPKAPLAPGSDNAVLTLADGTTIPLDSATNGALAQQGNTQVLNANGSLSYKAGNNAGQVLYNTVTTPHGGQYQLTLADGSQVWLNAASSIRFPTAFTGSDRTVEITGEAYFEIAPNARQPFLVKVHDMQVNVLGTSFNIMAYPDEQAMKTTLVSGAVQVKSGNNTSVLKPGLQASLTKDQRFTVATADMDEALAWKEGKFRFRNTNIKTIMRQLSRWYNMEVDYKGDVSDIDLTGVISRREQADKLLKALETTQRVHFEVSGNKITVTPAAPR